VIATNTTLSREGVEHLCRWPRKPAAFPAIRVRKVHSRRPAIARAPFAGNELPIIAVGGITSGERARAKIEAGATLVQVYSGLIYRGPALV
jgi:dihydroorotate dehydrogenase